MILQVALPSRVLAAARLQCGAAGAGASRGLGVCAEHARLAARGESARAIEIGDFLGRLGPGRFSQCVLLVGLRCPTTDFEQVCGAAQAALRISRVVSDVVRAHGVAGVRYGEI